MISLKAEAEKDAQDKADAEKRKPKLQKKHLSLPASKGFNCWVLLHVSMVIAHTYMAQEALIKAGKKLGVDVRIETNGSEGKR